MWKLLICSSCRWRADSRRVIDRVEYPRQVVSRDKELILSGCAKEFKHCVQVAETRRGSKIKKKITLPRTARTRNTENNSLWKVGDRGVDQHGWRCAATTGCCSYTEADDLIGNGEGDQVSEATPTTDQRQTNIRVPIIILPSYILHICLYIILLHFILNYYI